jgi:hypothetical protein
MSKFLKPSPLVLLGSLLLLATLVCQAHAQVPLDKYPAVKGSKWFEAYLDGVGNGYFMANGWQRGNNLPLLYCQPAHLALNAQNYLQMLDGYISKRAEDRRTRDMPVELLLLLALKQAFPCE